MAARASRLLAAGRIDEASAVLARSERNWQDHPQVFAQRVWVTGMYGDPRGALALIEQRRRATGHEPELLPFTQETLAWRVDPATLDRARLDRQAAAAFAEAPESAWFTASAMLRMGETERAFAWLARAPMSDAFQQWSILF